MEVDRKILSLQNDVLIAYGGIGNIFSMICESSKEKGLYFIFKFNYESNLVSILEPNEIRFLMSIIETYDSRYSLKLAINFVTIRGMDEFEKNPLKLSALIFFIYENVEIFNGLNKDKKPKCMWKLLFDGENIPFINSR